MAKFMRSSAEATIPGSPLIIVMTKAGVSEWVEFREPVIIPQGYGLITVMNSVNAAVVFSAEFSERAV